MICLQFLCCPGHLTSFIILFIQVQLHPSILPADFDITPTGELVLNLPPSPADSFQNGYDPEGNNRNASASFNSNVSKGISKDVVPPQQVCTLCNFCCSQMHFMAWPALNWTYSKILLFCTSRNEVQCLWMTT